MEKGVSEEDGGALEILEVWHWWGRGRVIYCNAPLSRMTCHKDPQSWQLFPVSRPDANMLIPLRWPFHWLWLTPVRHMPNYVPAINDHRRGDHYQDKSGCSRMPAAHCHSITSQWLKDLLPTPRRGGNHNVHRRQRAAATSLMRANICCRFQSATFRNAYKISSVLLLVW